MFLWQFVFAWKKEKEHDDEFINMQRRALGKFAERSGSASPKTKVNSLADESTVRYTNPKQQY